MEHGTPEDVLILIQGVHQEIPEAPQANQPIYIAPPPPNAGTQVTSAPSGANGAGATEADRLRAIYQSVGEAQGHTYGTGEVGSRPPDFTRLPGAQPGTRAPSGAPADRNPAAAAPAPPADAPARPQAVPPPSDQPQTATPPARKSAIPPAGDNPSDASRRANQAAGAPKGPPHQP